jgi:DNA-binding response OmpR family regulator
MEKLLIIEDDQALYRPIKHVFEYEGFVLHFAADGESGLDTFRNVAPSLVVLDLKLPKIHGRELCRTMKHEAPEVPIIVLSALADVVDKVLMLELGADDYVTKPFSPKELLARVRSVLRRARALRSSGEQYRFENVSIDFTKMELTQDGVQVSLTPHEFKLLKYFVRNPERVISRDELLNEVWGYNCYPSTRTVDNHLVKLRQKLEKNPLQPSHFKTVHGAGYKFVP